MNRNLNTVIISCFSALILVITNPKREDHISQMNFTFQEYLASNVDEDWQEIVQFFLGNTIGQNLIGRHVKTDSFLFFSASKAKIDGKNQYVSIGIMGNVFLFFDNEDVKYIISQMQDESKNNTGE
ncbi:hypothetical protein [Moheibacter sediminis]|uniref:DUF4359 domain-containing protein n=1 Tax=Moheibacter sediminis TaxID=1434700 RepID=A0A1W1YLE2_9FLAO|nr:hypothetical protein [Moheibacter sediminis]SMC37015.1 hypothetical protein SAMN06296427_101531 [Moheibacter sediminis]